MRELLYAYGHVTELRQQLQDERVCVLPTRTDEDGGALYHLQPSWGQSELFFHPVGLPAGCMVRDLFSAPFAEIPTVFCLERSVTLLMTPAQARSFKCSKCPHELNCLLGQPPSSYQTHLVPDPVD